MFLNTLSFWKGLLMNALPTAKTRDIGSVFAFDSIPTPGAYVCNWSGHLLRLPHEAVTVVGTPKVNIVGEAPLTVTKLSDDPYLPLPIAKQLAQQMKLATTF